MRLKTLDLFVLLRNQLFARLDGLNLLKGELNALLWNLRLIEATILIFRAVAIIDPVDEIKEGPQRQDCILGGDTALRVNREISEFVYADEPAPNTLINTLPKRLLMQKRREIIAVRHANGIIDCIDPFNRQLERLATTNRTERRRSRVDLLGLDASISKEVVIPVGTL